MGETSDRIEFIAEDYENAADILDTDGWQQGNFGHPGVPGCLAGALRKAAGQRLGNPFQVIWSFDWHAASKALGLPAPTGIVPVPLIAWNDAPGRTKGEVQDLLRTAAKKLREEVAHEV
jgi:hypothetical protein